MPSLKGIILARSKSTPARPYMARFSIFSRLHDAQHSTLYGIRRFAQTLTLDLAAIRNAITERWING